MVLIDDRQDTLDAKQYNHLIEKAVNLVINECSVTIPVEVSISLVNNVEIRELNARYRGIDAATDVLSFPLIDFNSCGNVDVNEVLKKSHEESYEQPIGDIIISMDKVVGQADAYGHSVKRELAFLTVHGMYHLFGYEHENKEETIIMRQKEDRVMERLNLVRE